MDLTSRRSHDAEHAFADTFGFYRKQVWWIDSFVVRHGHYYRYAISGRNGMRGDESIHWSIPDLVGDYAIALRQV